METTHIEEYDHEQLAESLKALASGAESMHKLTIVIGNNTASKLKGLLKQLERDCDMVVVDSMPEGYISGSDKMIVIGDNAQLPPLVNYVDVIKNRNANLMHGRGSKGDRIRRRQQFKNQCGYRGRTK